MNTKSISSSQCLHLYKLTSLSNTRPYTTKMCPGSIPRHHNPTVTSDFRPAFNVLDNDRDGKISSNDLNTFYAGFTYSNASNEVDIGDMMSVADVNKDGYVEFDEFNQVLKGNQGKLSSSSLLEDVFKVMDRDGDGKVGFDDLRGHMKLAGFDASDEEIMSMINLGSGDETSGVCFEGLVKILAVAFGQEF